MDPAIQHATLHHLCYVNFFFSFIFSCFLFSLYIIFKCLTWLHCCHIKVIGKLSEGRASHVPYRDSKLTRLLQSSLSGHGHVSVSLRCDDNFLGMRYDVVWILIRLDRYNLHAPSFSWHYFALVLNHIMQW